jgi:hypothetical protein
MGRASRLKQNPDRERHRRRQQHAERSIQPTTYDAGASMSFDSMVKIACVHEAGHVVASLALGGDVGYAIVDATNDAKGIRIGGYTETRWPIQASSPEEAQAAGLTPDALRKRTVIALAGRVVESAVNNDDGDLRSGGAGDEEDGARLALMATRRADGSFAPDEVHSYMTDRNREAVALLQPLLPNVERVAVYLLNHLNEEVPGEILRTVASPLSAED